MEELKDEKYIISKFQNYEKNDNGYDRGQAVKEIAKSIVDLINDSERLEQERDKASQIRRNTDVSGFGVSAKSNSKTNPFGHFSSKDTDKNFFKSENQISDTYFNFKPTENSRTFTETKKQPETYVTKTNTKYNVENTEAKPSPKKEEAPVKESPKKSDFKKFMKPEQKVQAPVVDLLDSDAGLPSVPVQKKSEEKNVFSSENWNWQNPNKENTKNAENQVTQKPQETLTDNINKLYQQYGNQPQFQQQQQYQQYPTQNQFQNQYQQFQYQPQPQTQNFGPYSKSSVTQSSNFVPLQTISNQNKEPAKKKTLEELTDLSDLGTELKNEMNQRNLQNQQKREEVDQFYMMNFGGMNNNYQNRGFNGNQNPTYLYR